MMVRQPTISIVGGKMKAVSDDEEVDRSVIGELAGNIRQIHSSHGLNRGLLHNAVDCN